MTVSPGATVTASVSNGPGNAHDWIAVFPTGAPSTGYLDWKYLNNTRIAPSTGVTTATVTFPMPSTTGTYEIRLYLNDTYTLVGTSDTITVDAGTEPSITATPTAVGPNGSVTATIANGPGGTSDWVGL